MRVYYEFDPLEDKEELESFQNGPNAICVVSEMDNWFRQQIKYHSDDYTQDQLDTLEEARGALRELCEAYSLSRA